MERVHRPMQLILIQIVQLVLPVSEVAQ